MKYKLIPLNLIKLEKVEVKQISKFKNLQLSS